MTTPEQPASRPGAGAILGTILADAWGMLRVCGPGTTARWLWNIASHARACVAERNLQPADRAMGDGPIRANLRGARAVLMGEQAISGVRELWIRDLYLYGGFLKINDGDTVVDLGANMGNFSMLALAHGPSVRLFAVEPSTRECEKWRRSVARNGWESRATLVQAFIGGNTATQDELRAMALCNGTQVIGEAEFLSRFGITRVDFLKCDIEGSEYELLRPGSPLLAMTRQLAIEVHADAGSVAAFEQMLRDEGFEVIAAKRHPSADVLVARRPARG